MGLSWVLFSAHVTYHICTPLSGTVQVEVAWSPKTLVSTVKSTWHNNPINHNLNPVLPLLPILWFYDSYEDVFIVLIHYIIWQW
jgi:hypothetical protein